MDVHEQIEYISQFMTLNEGDFLLTGTPPGSDFIAPGDHIECELYQGDQKLLELENFVQKL